MDQDKRIERIWRWYKRRPGKRLRDVLLEHYANLLAREGKKLRARLPATVELDDLVSDGAFGLLDAIDRYIPGGTSFKTFSSKRIRGAMVDGLRARDPISRSCRRVARKIEEAAESIRTQSGARATPQQVAERMGVGAREYARQERVTRQSVTRSLSGQRIWDDEPAMELSAEQIADDRQESPSRSLMRKALREQVTTGLSRAERLLIVLYYYEGLTMKEVGSTLDLSESRISQMHTSILARLKATLTESHLIV